MSVAEHIPSDLLTISKAAEATGVPEFIIRRRVKSGVIRGYTRRGKLYVSESGVRDYDRFKPLEPGKGEEK